MIETLKFPTGEFTHTELAQLNGKTNQQVWVRYQAAIKSGQIISAGERKSASKGKPSKLWKVNPNFVADTVPTPAPVVVKTPVAAPTPVVETPVEVKVEVSEPTPVVQSAVESGQLVVVDEPIVVPIVQIAPIEPARPPVVQVKPPAPVVPPTVVENKIIDASEIEETCPVCKHKMLALKEPGGVRVWCSQPIEICVSTENPFGFGKTLKEAVEVCNSKWKFAMAGGSRE